MPAQGRENVRPVQSWVQNVESFQVLAGDRSQEMLYQCGKSIESSSHEFSEGAHFPRVNSRKNVLQVRRRLGLQVVWTNMRLLKRETLLLRTLSFLSMLPLDQARYVGSNLE